MEAVAVRRARFFQARPRRIEIKTSQLFRMPADGCLATTNASGAQPPERFGKKGESSAPSVFHAFLGAICERPLLCCCVPLCSLTHRTLRREQRALSLCLSLSRVFSLTFRVSSASGLFFTLVCSTYLLTSRVLVNVGFVQTWCLVECDSRLCLSEICFFFFKPFKPRECLTLSCCISFKKKGSSGIKLYYKLISYTHIPGVKKKKKRTKKKIIHTDHKKIKS